MESKPASPKKIVTKEATLNEKLTDRMTDDRRYSLYVQWAKDNGVIMDKVRNIFDVTHL
jgi:hypothetical protein